MVSVAVTLLFLLTVLLAALFTWRWWHFSYFKRIGVAGPKPNLIWGNLLEYHSTDIYKVIGRWIEKYGDIFGFYNGDVPFVVTQDLELIEEVYVRNFSNFTGRGETMMIEKLHPIMCDSIIHVEGWKWRSTRKAVAGAFSPGKLKLMMPLINKYVTGLVETLEEAARLGREVNMLPMFEELSLHLVVHVSFGIDGRVPGSPGHSVSTDARNACLKLMTGPLHMIAQSTTCFGSLIRPLSWISLIAANLDKVTRQMAKIIEIRKMDPLYRRPDILQHLLDVEYGGIDMADKDAWQKNGRVKSRSLTTVEVVNFAATIFVAGYETIASLLSYLTFVLAKYPDVQEKVRQEVVDTISEQGKLDFETVTRRLVYLEQVIKETGRLYPPGLTFVTRQAKEDFTYRGTQFKAATCFMVPLYQIQRDPRFWPDPLQFNPERFGSKNEAHLIKVAYMPFGLGPRNCVGKSMATLILKLAMAKLLLQYRLELGPSQMGEMQINSRAMVSTPENGPWVIIRHHNSHR
ncbi:cytochrome P450 3A24 isoform X2 [Rhipicephalus microplus]|uniref:cytochrome P450 3A24 isoform X2 n=1 Tax=Rhipicephalus microplus TaxID=6941 RepID=UPI003F6C9E70